MMPKAGVAAVIAFMILFATSSSGLAEKKATVQSIVPDTAPAMQNALAVTRATISKILEDKGVTKNEVKVPSVKKEICVFKNVSGQTVLDCQLANTHECPGSVDLFIDGVGFVTAETQNCKYVGDGECDCELVLS